jgi:two-component system, LytTR family, response regulator
VIRALIVDDEPVARRRIRRLLSSEHDVVVAGECGDGDSAIVAIGRDRPDLVFLDVQMPEKDGFAVLRAVGDAMPPVVFVTAFDQYALAAFEVHALDYLLKPFSRIRFQEAVRRARAEVARSQGPGAAGRVKGLLAEMHLHGRYLSRFVVPTATRVLLVDVGTVDWIEAADNYAILHAGQTSHAIRETLTRLAAELDPERFVRIHRSAIVQIDRVRELLPAFHGDYVAVLHDGTRLALSRSYRPQVEALLRRPL